ncbi:hypothetical protein ACEZCY_02585 [Streptacidiphilus sp. N1-12]|uniref:Uncharacterized protein n=2 Tax=Streptacidiphilus alkalitolerans TaxID=3342712 RepID=A0ABV6W7T0_9ACTN
MANTQAKKAPTQSPVSESVIPLGPWTGAVFEAWAGKTGSVWHADPECRSLRSRARTESYAQPAAGTLDARNLPGRLHCLPPGALSDYAGAAKFLVDFTGATAHGRAELREGRMDLSLLVGEQSLASDGWEHLKSPALDALWQEAERDRRSLAEDLQRQLTHRLPMMLAAQWILNGKTPRRRQPRYTAFLNVAADEFKAREITASTSTRYLDNEDLLPFWLHQVAHGRSATSATTDMSERVESETRHYRSDLEEDFYTRLRAAMAQVGQAWAHKLDGVVLAHSGDVAALFDEHKLLISWDLQCVLASVLPCARLRTTDFSWVAGRVPAILSLFLRERDKGLVGLVLETERTQTFEAEQATLLLRNIVRLLDRPALLDHIAQCGAEPIGPRRPITVSDHVESELHWQLHGFGYGIHDAGLTPAKLLPAIQATWDGCELETPRSRGAASRQGRPTRPRTAARLRDQG